MSCYSSNGETQPKLKLFMHKIYSDLITNSHKWSDERETWNKKLSDFCKAFADFNTHLLFSAVYGQEKMWGSISKQYFPYTLKENPLASISDICPKTQGSSDPWEMCCNLHKFNQSRLQIIFMWHYNSCCLPIQSPCGQCSDHLLCQILEILLNKEERRKSFNRLPTNIFSDRILWVCWDPFSANSKQIRQKYHDTKKIFIFLMEPACAPCWSTTS